MAKKKKKARSEKSDELSADPDARLCSKFDSTGIAKFPIASRDDMGMRVRDNCAEEHIM